MEQSDVSVAMSHQSENANEKSENSFNVASKNDKNNNVNCNIVSNSSCEQTTTTTPTTLTPPATKSLSNTSFDAASQLEKWNKVRESLYSQHGWSSDNVNQNSKWDVGTMDGDWMKSGGGDVQSAVQNTGTNNWNSQYNVAAQAIDLNSVVDASPTGDFASNPSDQIVLDDRKLLDNWQNSGAIPKSFASPNAFGSFNSARISSPTFPPPKVDHGIGAEHKAVGMHLNATNHRPFELFGEPREPARVDESHQWKLPTYPMQPQFPRAITKKSFRPMSSPVDQMQSKQTNLFAQNSTNINNQLPFDFQNLTLNSEFNGLQQQQQQQLRQQQPQNAQQHNTKNNCQLSNQSLFSHQPTNAQQLLQAQQNLPSSWFNANDDSSSFLSKIQMSNISDRMQPQQNSFFSNNTPMQMQQTSTTDFSSMLGGGSGLFDGSLPLLNSSLPQQMAPTVKSGPFSTGSNSCWPNPLSSVQSDFAANGTTFPMNSSFVDNHHLLQPSRPDLSLSMFVGNHPFE